MDGTCEPEMSGAHISLSCEQCFILFSSFLFFLAFDAGDLGFEFCVFVGGWRHALRSELPFIFIFIVRSLNM